MPPVPTGTSTVSTPGRPTLPALGTVIVVGGSTKSEGA